MSSSEDEPRLQIAPEKLDENVVVLITGANTCVNKTTNLCVTAS